MLPESTDDGPFRSAAADHEPRTSLDRLAEAPTVLGGPGGDLGTRVEPQFRQDVLDMVGGRPLRDHELVGEPLRLDLGDNSDKVGQAEINRCQFPLDRGVGSRAERQRRRRRPRGSTRSR